MPGDPPELPGTVQQAEYSIGDLGGGQQMAVEEQLDSILPTLSDRAF